MSIYRYSKTLKLSDVPVQEKQNPLQFQRNQYFAHLKSLLEADITPVIKDCLDESYSSRRWQTPEQTLDLAYIEACYRKYETDNYAGEVNKDDIEVIGFFSNVINELLELEKLWALNLYQSDEVQQNRIDERSRHIIQNDKIIACQQADARQTNLAKLKKLARFLETVDGWSSSRIKVQTQDQKKKEINTRTKREGNYASTVATLVAEYENEYFSGLRQYLMAHDFHVSPDHLPMAAIFPQQDWLKINADTVTTADLDDEKYELLTHKANDLMESYQILGTSYHGINYKYFVNEKKSKVGCVCVSWIIYRANHREVYYVPVLGFSGDSPNLKTESLDAALGACCLPAYSKDEQVENYYDDVIHRANHLAINYRVRDKLGLRLPSRQAMLSYLGLSKARVSSDDLNVSDSDLESSANQISPAIATWHSLNCAEPSALAWISSYFVDGVDVVLCCPFEGGDEPGEKGLKPKETCPWCATVEIAYRSIKETPEENWGAEYDHAMRTGSWKHVITKAHTFSGQEQGSRERLPRNKADYALAYADPINSRIYRLRQLFCEVGILTWENIRS